MKKTMKFVAISLMALALFSCNKKNNEPSCTDAVLSLRIDEATLRALEGSQVETPQTNTKTEVTSDVILMLHPSGRKITLSDDQITAAKSAAGAKIEIGEVVAQVSMTANGIITDNTDITTLQGKALSTDIPLVAEATNVGAPREENGNTIYPVTLTPKPGVARIEVSGKIEPVANDAGKNAFESIEVTNVYVNNYLATRVGNRTYVESNGSDNFQTDPNGKMMDEVPSADKTEFEARTKVAGYQLFPKKENEVASAVGYFDHIILKMNVKYSADAIKAGYPATPQVRFVTIQRFMKTTSGDLEGFEAGTIYKLNLGELSKDFKTDDNGTPNPGNPDTPDPEPKGKKLLEVKVEPYVWTIQDITPDVNEGYKK